MKHLKAAKRLMKETIVVILGITIAFSALMLPDITFVDSFTASLAYTFESGENKFTYIIEEDRNVKTLVIKGMEKHGDTIEIPSYITHDKVKYAVTNIGDDFLREDDTVKTVVFPDTVKYIGKCVLYTSSLENVTLPDGLEHLGSLFAGKCDNLKQVTYNGSRIKNGEIGSDIFDSSNPETVVNENGAICLGNWLLKYDPEKVPKTLRIADLANEGTKIEKIAPRL